MFKHLRHKLTVFYVALFVGVLGMIASAVYVAAAHHVEQIGRSQLAASSTVFQNLLDARARGLQDEADILAHDYGFRAAVATGDDATVRSALDNLATRLGIELAFVVNVDGRVAAQVADAGVALPPEVVRAVQADDAVSGAFQIDGTTYTAVAAPIRTPTPAGWVVFATRLGAEDTARLERVSAIPLKAAVLARRGDGRWVAAGDRRARGFSPALQGLLAHSAAGAQGAAPSRLSDQGGASLVLVRPLAALGAGQQVALMLRYPMADALKPFRPLFGDIVVIGAVGVALLVIASWLIAATLTRPVSALADAARRLQHGEPARVAVGAGDEIGRLGVAFNAMADDIEDREAKLTGARDQAQAADRAKTEFLANMNHEFRTPLNGVLGMASVLSASRLDPEQRRVLSLIESSGQALQGILNDVLDMVELGSGGLTLSNAPLDLAALLRTLADETAAAAHAKGLSFIFDLDPAASGWVCGDARRVTQVLSNLLSNAVKFTDKGQVGLRVGCGPGAYRFEVRDTGVGFAPAMAETIFRPFSQADGSSTRRFGGTGLGLSLARETARAMGGDLVAQGAPGLGARFVATLPLAPCAAPVSPHPPVEVAAVDAPIDDPPALRVLLAEDHPTNRALVELILKAVGVDLVSVENGAEAVAAFKTQGFDVVLMDLQMPVMDGLTAIRLIREHEGTGARTPILVLSANAQGEHLCASAHAGADRHLAKPIVAPVLIAALEQALAAMADPEPQRARAAVA